MSQGDHVPFIPCCRWRVHPRLDAVSSIIASSHSLIFFFRTSFSTVRPRSDPDGLVLRSSEPLAGARALMDRARRVLHLRDKDPGHCEQLHPMNVLLVYTSMGLLVDRMLEDSCRCVSLCVCGLVASIELGCLGVRSMLVSRLSESSSPVVMLKGCVFSEPSFSFAVSR